MQYPFRTSAWVLGGGAFVLLTMTTIKLLSWILYSDSTVASFNILPIIIGIAQLYYQCNYTIEIITQVLCRRFMCLRIIIIKEKFTEEPLGRLELPTPGLQDQCSNN